MKIISLVCSAFAFSAMTSIVQAEPTAMKQTESMRLAASQMDNITAGSVRVNIHASGTESIYSRAADFSITPNDEVSITVDCCGADTTYTNVVVIPRDDPYQIN